MEDGGLGLTTVMLKTIGEDTKMKILRELSNKPMIPTDMGRRLSKSIPTILEHLEKLANAGLVEKRVQPGRKYVFYSLTQNGMSLISDRGRLSAMLYGAVSLFIVGISLFALASYGSVTSGTDQQYAKSSAQALSATSAPSPSFVLFSLVSVAILACAFVLLLMYVRKSKRTNIKTSE